MTENLMRERVYILAFRFPELGVAADINGLTARELEGLYRFLSRLAMDE